jgi:TetR/AcrR family hemagglutinin/protease transcriptional regulator
MRVFARRGIGRGSHADVAREAGVAVPTVFAYFQTREELVRAVLAEVVRYYTAMADEYHVPTKPAPSAQLDHAIAFAASVDTHPDHARVLLEWSTSVRDEIWPLFLRFHQEMVSKIEATIRRGQRQGDVSRELDAENAALMIIGAVHLLVQMKFTRCPPEKVHRFQLALLRGAIGPDAVARALA